MLKMRKDVKVTLEIDGDHWEVFEKILEVAGVEAEKTLEWARTEEQFDGRRHKDAMAMRDMIDAIRQNRTLDRVCP